MPGSVGDFRVIYVAEDSGLFASAARVFQKFMQSISGLPDASNAEQERLLAYFKSRRAYEDRDFTHFDTSALIHFREEKNHFAGDYYETLYSVWKAADVDAADHDQNPPDAPQDASQSRFATQVLEHNYDLFGTLTSRNRKRTKTESQTEIPTDGWDHV